ncbi:hypothetical protein BH10PLA2_BH10PLA2_30090 [soil metagenome]
MATKLAQLIAEVAIAVGSRDRAAMVKTASAAASQLSEKDLVKLPDLWFPTISAKKVGAPELKEFWDLSWFEAMTELLLQKGREGLPGLFVLAERDDSTYHHFVFVRLLRSAADGIDTEATLTRVRQRLTTLQHVWTIGSVREIVYWTQVDSRPFELLKPMSDVVLPRMDGDTVGVIIQRMVEELAYHLAQMKTQES